MHEHDDEKSTWLYFMAGVGVGALIGAAAGLLFAPKSGVETREDLSKKFDDLKHKVSDWMKERKEKKATGVAQSPDEVGA
jgi:gas vesicle protein